MLHYRKMEAPVTYEQLQKLTIFEVREIARRAGIVPGTRRKQDIIKDILAVREGKILPNTDKKHGRPAKSLGFADFFAPVQEYSTEQTNKEMHTDLVLNQDEYNFNIGEEFKLNGYLQFKNQTAVLLEIGENRLTYYAIPANFMTNRNLRQGDRLQVMAGTTAKGGIVNQILKVNGKSINNVGVRTNFDAIKHTHANVEITNSLGLDLLFGETYFVYGNNANENTTALVDLLNNSKADCKIYINPTVSEKSKILLAPLKADVEQFTSRLTDERSTSCEIISLAIERIKRAFEFEKNVLVVIDDLNSVMGLEPDSNKLANNLLNLTKNAEKGAISIVAIVEDNKYSLRYSKLADKTFVIEDGKIAPKI